MLNLISALFSLFTVYFFAFAALSENFNAHESHEELPPEIAQDLDLLMVHRHGKTSESHMETLGIIQAVKPKITYRLTMKGFSKIDSPEVDVTTPVTPSIPNYLQLSGTWTTESSDHSSNANILGEIDTFYIETNALRIPVAIATESDLAYYGAHLHKIGDMVSFESDANLPVTIMNIGKNYARDYLMAEGLGGGFYLEFHDRPHFHMPLDNEASGYLVLGKKVGDHLYQLTAFSIPFGYAVHTPGGIIHDDGLLIGNYMVIYSVTKEFKTAVIKDRKNAIAYVEATEPLN